jgi:catechol 2,3-dioxygenase-like lactoylglutathione lyase family enzyme
MTPTITGILETCLYIADLERAARFYEAVLGFQKVDGDERFQGMGVSPGHVLVLFVENASNQPNPLPNGEIIPPHDGHGQIHLPSPSPPTNLTRGANAWRKTTSPSKRSPPAARRHKPVLPRPGQ